MGANGVGPIGGWERTEVNFLVRKGCQCEKNSDFQNWADWPTGQGQAGSEKWATKLIVCQCERKTWLIDVLKMDLRGPFF